MGVFARSSLYSNFFRMIVVFASLSINIFFKSLVEISLAFD